MNQELVIYKIQTAHPNLRVVEVSQGYATVQDAYGICRLQVHSLFSGSKPTVSTALNKTAYFISRLKIVQPGLIVIGTYKGALVKIVVRDRYGLCESLPSSLLVGAKPSVKIALNKTEYYINQAQEVHGDRYVYSKTKYINAKTKIAILCKKHGYFEQWPAHHLNTNGCLKCAHQAKEGGNWYKNADNAEKLACVYVLRLTGEDETFFKFGVSVNLDKRILTLKNSCLGYEIKLLKKITGKVGYCYELEQRFKRKILRNKLQYVPSIRFGGRYECFKTHP